MIDSIFQKFSLSDTQRNLQGKPPMRTLRTGLNCCLFLLMASVGLADEIVETRAGQPCWIVRSSTVEVAITKLGGQMAPVTFQRETKAPLRPYYVSPWQEEKLDLEVPVLKSLRGDFFCMPFGGNADEFRGEKHPPHGEVAGSEWSFVSSDVGKTKDGKPVHTLTLSLTTKARPGKVTKKVMLVDGENVVYTQHIIEGFKGPTPIAHHATLAMPDTPRAVKIKVSPFQFGMTNPGVFSDPAKREYQSLEIGAKFTDLAKVPLQWKGAPDADLTALPDRVGFADLIGLVNTQDAKSPGWTTAYNSEAKSLWFSLKDTAVLPMTVFWIENHGRHASPWNGRNNCLGLEDVCAYFADGLVPSVTENKLTSEGVKTAHMLSGEKPFVVNYIQGAVSADSEVESIQFRDGQMVVSSPGGKTQTIPVRHEFLKSGAL
jgi:hypothetical protein